MRTIKLELTVEVPSNYKIDEGMTDFAQVCDLLDEMEDRYSNVGLIEGRIIGEQNDGKEGEVIKDTILEAEEEHWKPSDEQMEWLESAVKLSTDKTYIHGIIVSLYEQLKKL